jgi:transcriptional regulator with XRE-family HTH domain
MSDENHQIDGNLLKTPYEDLVPRMTEQEFDGFEASILEHGQKDAIEIDEENSVLDGHHRLRVLNKHGIPVLFTVNTGLKSDLEKRAYVISKALNRRNLTAESTKELRETQKKLYGELRAQDPQKWTLDRIAKICGVDRSLVGRWFNNGTDPITKPDARRKVTPEMAKQIEDELQTSSGNQVAKKYGLGKGTVSRIRNKGKKPAEKDQEFEDREMEELINEGEKHLRMAKDAFYGLDDEVLIAALQETFVEWEEIAEMREETEEDEA